MKINPSRIKGPWNVGYTLDVHTVSSTYLGENAAGHPQFDTTRSEIGESLYRLKYSGDKSYVKELASVAARFLREKEVKLDVVVPLPPSKSRSAQPVTLVGRELAGQLHLDFGDGLLRKIKKTPELKSMTEIEERQKALAEAFEATSHALAGRRVLLFDDLYRSGASMAAAASTLLEEGGADYVFALALTRTRTNR